MKVDSVKKYLISDASLFAEMFDASSQGPSLEPTLMSRQSYGNRPASEIDSFDSCSNNSLSNDSILWSHVVKKKARNSSKGIFEYFMRYFIDISIRKILLECVIYKKNYDS